MWHKTHAPYARHARINGQHYKVYSSEVYNRHYADCEGETIGSVEGTLYDPNERIEEAQLICERHAFDADGRIEFGENPCPVPEFVTRCVG